MPQFSFLMNHVSKTYMSKNIKTEVLKDISLKIMEGEFICIMGSTGCGKSTLMRIISGIERCSSGEFYFFNTDASGRMPPSILSHLGVIFQSDNLLEWRTVYQNVKLPLEIFHQKRGLGKEIMSMLKLVGLQEYKNCYPKELSGGMRQRCAIARALVHQPDMLLLDQPFGALDAITRKALNQELLHIWRERKNTVVMVTNNINEALTLATRVIVLSPAPAEILADVQVPLTFEERTHDLLVNPKFLELRSRLDKLVRGSEAQDGGGTH
ncbi:MAG: uncharacterized protein H6Q60_1437 [Oscillospiraceae bacterium]|nr:uncharacterized protein [Oscillospiraceae bacterium]